MTSFFNEPNLLKQTSKRSTQNIYLVQSKFFKGKNRKISSDNGLVSKTMKLLILTGRSENRVKLVEINIDIDSI